MLISASRRKVAAVAAAMLAAIGMMVAPMATPANAQQGNLVVFGDSWVSDPPLDQYIFGRFSPTPQGSSGVGEWCPTSNTNFGKNAAAQLGLVAHDYSCTGTTTISPGPQFSTQVDRAINSGGLNASTRRVLISTGFNDTYNNATRPHGEIRRDFVNYMRPQVDRIRAVAPNARIQFVGYPQITDGRGNVCLFHIAPNVRDTTPAPQIASWENLSQWMLVDAAAATGSEFIDLKPSTRGNSMCAPDDRRMWAGVVDFYGGPGNLPFHVNQRGHAHVGNVVAAS